MAAMLVATIASAGDSAPFLLDTVTTSTSPVVDSLPISWDASWIGGKANATVIIADNGTEVKRTTGAGEFMHTLTGAGRHDLTYTTYIGGIAQGEVYAVTVYTDDKGGHADAKGDSAPFLLDTVTTSTSPVVDSLSVSWDASWIGGKANATVVIADNGMEVKRTTGAGEFTHTLTGAGRHDLTYTTYIGGIAQGEVYAVTFTVASKALTVEMVGTVGNVTYNGSAHTPEPTVTDPERGITLVKGVDYTLSWGENTAAGSGSVTVTGKGNYAGSVTNNFTIAPKTLVEDMVGAVADVTYNGSVFKPEPTVTDPERGVTLVKGTDYTLSWGANTEVGLGNVTVTGTTNYTGTVTRNFTIKPVEKNGLEKAFDGLPVSIVSDEGGGWIATITNDIDFADLPIEIPDNIGNITIDLNGHDLIGGDGGALGESALPDPAIRIVSSDGDGEPTQITIVNSGDDAMVQGGEGAPAIEVAEDAQDGVLINIGEGVTVQGGDVYTPAIIGEIGTNEGTIVEPSLLHIPGEGTVTTPKTWKSGQKVTWKAKAAKGSVFAHWEGELVDSLGLSRNQLRNPSLQFAVPAGFDADAIRAVFIAVDDDRLGSLALSQSGPLAPNVEVVGLSLVDDSESYVTASMSGLPTGLKFDVKTLAVTGKPTKSGIYWVQVKAKNASGYQWAENIKVTVSGGGSEAKVPKLTRTAYYPLTVVSANAAEGTVSGTGVYAAGKKASISAKPAKGYVFAGWYLDPELTKPMTFASGDFRKASQSVIVPEARYLFARFVGATTAADPITGIAATSKSFRWCVGVSVPSGDCVAYVSASLPTVSASGLPSGVKFDAVRGCFTGVPTKAGEYSAVVTVKNASKSTAVLRVTINVEALPAWAQGAFSGGVVKGIGKKEEGRSEEDEFIGQVSLTVDAKGKISGKVLGDGQTYTLAAPSYSAREVDEHLGQHFLADVTASWSYKDGSKTVKTNEVVQLAVRDNGIGGYAVVQDWFEAYTVNWKVDSWKALGKQFDKKTLVYAIRNDGSFIDGEEAKATPLGSEVVGRVTVKFAANGTVGVAGEFVTGYDAKKQKYTTVKASGSATLVPVTEEDFIVVVYLTPKRLAPHTRRLEISAQ